MGIPPLLLSLPHILLTMGNLELIPSGEKKKKQKRSPFGETNPRGQKKEGGGLISVSRLNFAWFSLQRHRF